jgi:hypothetical protein
MGLRRVLCKVLMLLRMHRQDCECCLQYDLCWGDDIRKRLEDLRRTETPAPIGSAEPDRKGQPAA